MLLVPSVTIDRRTPSGLTGFTDTTLGRSVPAALVSYRPHVLRRSAKPEVRIAYRVSEKAHVLLYVNGRRVLHGGAKSLQFAVNWVTKRNGQRLPPDRYRLQLGAVDLAGNVGARTRTFIVRIR